MNLTCYHNHLILKLKLGSHYCLLCVNKYRIRMNKKAWQLQRFKAVFPGLGFVNELSFVRMILQRALGAKDENHAHEGLLIYV